jgi:ATP-dependent helicase HrpB
VRDDPIQRLLARPPDLPVVDGLAALTDALRARGVAVVQAPPGTGKTSLVPPAVAALRPGRVVVTQPRRIAARAAARRWPDCSARRSAGPSGTPSAATAAPARTPASRS